VLGVGDVVTGRAFFENGFTGRCVAFLRKRVLSQQKCCGGASGCNYPRHVYPPMASRMK
jgi:hypothetical protein